MRTLLPLAIAIISTWISGCHAKGPTSTANEPALAQQPGEEARSNASGLREEIYERARQRNGGREPSRLELLNELIIKGKEQAGAVSIAGKPRIVAKGPKPEIIIHGAHISIDGMSVAIGAPIETWKKALPQKPRCRQDSIRTMCVWDELGIQLLTQTEKNSAVLDFTIYQSLETLPPWSGQRPDGSPIKAPPDHRPKNAYPGYLELDGYGIDAKTEFWEIRASVAPWRNLRCGTRDCSHPRGTHDNTTNLYLRLNGTSDRSTLYEFTLSANPE